MQLGHKFTDGLFKIVGSETPKEFLELATIRLKRAKVRFVRM